jgi:hypothetical protein
VSKDYNYKITKRKASKVETLPAPAPIIESAQGSRYARTRFLYSETKKEQRQSGSCIICGQRAVYLAYFKVQGIQLMEKYYSQCLDKWVSK